MKSQYLCSIAAGALSYAGFWAFCGSYLSLATQCASVQASSPGINVALKASFDSAPYLIELLETAAQEKPSSYFPLLDRIAQGYLDDANTDQKLYELFTRALEDDGHLSDQESISTFKLSLSIHSAAPRIEAHYQFYNTTASNFKEEEDCAAWVLSNGKRYLDPSLTVSQDLDGPEFVHELPFDRTLGAHDAPPSILYADPTCPSFREFHHVLSDRAKQGQTSYRLRYKPRSERSGEPLWINSYGVELALKRTDYIVIDDRDADKSRVGAAHESTPEEVALKEVDVADIKPLSKKELAGLGLQAASFVMNSNDPFDTLIKLLDDFPRHSSVISAHNATPNFLEEYHKNRKIFLPGGYNIVWINGLQVDARKMDAFALLEQLRQERVYINGLRAAGLTSSEAVSLLSNRAIAEAKTGREVQRYDFRDVEEDGKAIIWLNDIEKDKRYDSWPRELRALFQQTYPGQLPTVRRDIHNLVVPVDLSDAEDVDLVVEGLQTFVKRKIPIRFGIVPSTKSDSATGQARVVYHLLETYGLSSIFTYLESAAKTRKLEVPSKSSFEIAIKERKLRREAAALPFAEVVQPANQADRLGAAEAYLKRLGGNSKPLLFINGVALPRNDEWLQAMSMRVNIDMRSLQQALYQEEISDDIWVPGYFLSDAAVSRNALVIPEDEGDIRMINLNLVLESHKEIYDSLPRLSNWAEAEKAELAHLITIGDFSTEQGQQLLLEAVAFAKRRKGVELILLNNPKEPSQRGLNSHSIAKLLDESAELATEDVMSTLKKSISAMTDSSTDASTNEELISSQALVEDLGFQPGQEGVVLNGRAVGPIPSSSQFSTLEFEQLLNYERTKRIVPVYHGLLGLHLDEKITTPLVAAKLSSLVALSSMSDVPESIFDQSNQLRIDGFNVWEANYTAILSGNNPDEASIQIVAAIDPASETAQRWVPILKVLSELDGVYLKLFLNPKEKLDELPIKRFYRQVLSSEPTFEEDGSLRAPAAHFTSIPAEVLLTTAMDVPPSWLVAPKESIHDLDNIKLSSLNGGSIDAIYELEHILIEGHARDTTLGPPPRGAQLVLGTEQDPHFGDTIIMANLGYFQFKANPGFWRIGLQEGRSQQIYQIDSLGTKGYNSDPATDFSTEIALTSFRGITLYPRLSRKPGQETADVLDDSPLSSFLPGTPLDYVSKGIHAVQDAVSKTPLLSNLLGKKTPSNPHADINIFSVASGHLYERMLNIMMVSVMKHTKHSVKFWFIEQFLSPSFKDSLPLLAAHYNFSYQMVTFKWPHWLRAQREKQREIWGYKILFLDVLFPLSLDKVIFVDADQIVRADMYDLVTLPLDDGAPYGFTPMCDSRVEMEGFRFWKQGYWKSFLRGKPYHISALYVVDLKRFRALAAGDRLRGQYHQLSADPESLSNLDQDLPNHMQSVLPIHSLPQDWLWCETWCSDESLASAKTIDLCNNPMTKEPKLDRARRQVPEWTDFDAEIAQVIRTGKLDGGSGGGDAVHGQDKETIDKTKERAKDEL